MTQGQGVGEAFRVLPWEARFLKGSLAPGVAEAALTVGRKAGKTTLCAGIATAFLDGDGIAPPASEITVVSATLKQSRRLFKHVARFLEASGRIGDYRKQDSASQCWLENKRDGRYLECLGANPGGLHGSAAALVLCDEVAQWPGARVDAMLAALRTGLGAIPGGRLILLGTRARAPDHPFSLALKTADYVQIHAARPDDPIGWKRTWQRACPSLRYFPALEAATRAEARKAKQSPDALASFKALRLNMGTSDVAESLLLEAGIWKGATGLAYGAGPYVLGVDLGTTSSMSAASGYWPETGRLEAVACFGAVPDLRSRGLSDGVGGLYLKCEERGELVTSPGRVSDLKTLLGEVWERWGAPSALVCDRWREGELRDALAALRFPKAALVTRGMGYKDGGEDVRCFRRAFLAGEVTPVESLLLTSAMGEARTISDPAGNAKLAKKSEGGRRRTARDDAAAAAILAVALAWRRRKAMATDRGGLRTAVVR